MFKEEDFVLEIPGSRGLARKNIAERANALHEERCIGDRKRNEVLQKCAFEAQKGWKEAIEQCEARVAEIERLRETLNKIREFTGPPKMSETMMTAFTRLREIRRLTDIVLPVEVK